MRKWLSFTILMLVLLTIFPISVEAHAPKFPMGNEAADSAYVIDDVSKSSVIYNRLGYDSAHYYALKVDDERLLIQLLVPVYDFDRGFRPHIALMVPDWSEGAPLPSYVVVPDGFGYEVLETEVAENAEYEGFTATSFYVIVDFDELTTELYEGELTLLIAVFHSSGMSGNYAIVVGYEESFTSTELLMVPFDLLRIYQWQGSDMLLVMTPILLILLMGAILMMTMRNNGELDLSAFLGISGGSLMIGTAATATVQMLIALSNSGLSTGIVITSLLVIMGLAGGASSILLNLQEIQTRKKRIVVVFSALLGILSFNGLVLGPILVILSALR